MKKLFFSLAFMLIGSFAFANLISGINPKFKKFEIANFEVLNLDRNYLGNFLFKKNDCKTGGYSFFSPFETIKDLKYSFINSERNGDVITIKITVFDKVISNFDIKNIKISDNNKEATFTIESDKHIFNSKLYGENLTINSFFESFNNFNNATIFSEDCPPCVAVLVIAAAATVADICTTASSACSPCNGKLTVGACSCSCIPK